MSTKICTSNSILIQSDVIRKYFAMDACGNAGYWHKNCTFPILLYVLLAAGVSSSELGHFIVDNEDGQYDDSLHQAAWRGDVEELRRLLTQGAANIDMQLRPFYATPLRLAAVSKYATSSSPTNSLNRHWRQPVIPLATSFGCDCF